MEVKIVCNGKSFCLEAVIEDVIDEYFEQDEEFITHFTMMVRDYVSRETLRKD